MKTRTGFVSNSSSSSFILALRVKPSSYCSHCGRSDSNFLDMVRSRSETDGGNQVTSEDLLAVREELKGWYGD